MSSSTTGCVHCHAPLQLRDHENVQVLACPEEHGLFIHADSLRAALHDLSGDRPDFEEQAAEAAQGPLSLQQLNDGEAPRTCPTCGAAMTKQVFAYESGVPIDVCDEHGVWLDHGELHRIEAWHEAQLRHLESDRATWGGATGRLEQVEEQYERDRAEQVRGVHWGPIGHFAAALSWKRDRRDD